MSPRAEGIESEVVRRLTDGIEPAEVRHILVRCLGGELASSDALLELMMASNDAAIVRHAIDEVTRRADEDSRASDRMVRDRVDDLTQLVVDAENGVDRVVDRTRTTPVQYAAVADATGHEIESREALWLLPDELRGVALGTLFDVLTVWGSVHAAACALELGCGSGRVLAVLASRVKEAHGVERDGALAAAARRRTEALSSAFVIEGHSGHDLATHEPASFDLVLAVDYLAALADDAQREDAIREAARVLRPGGHLVIVNWSLDLDPEPEAERVVAAAVRHGLVPRRIGERPVAVWRALVHQLAKG